MKKEMIIRRFAGAFVLASLLLARWHSPYWLWFTAFVGFNLLQSSFTGFCPLEIIVGIILGQRAVGGAGGADANKTTRVGWVKVKQPRAFLWALAALAILVL